MPAAISKDGTQIAFERAGTGPPLILVDGALCYRGSGPARPLAATLTSHFSVITYDRRGRGESTDTAPYAVDREVEDLEALLREAGGSAFVYGISSGAALALNAARRIEGIRKLVLYEAPFLVDHSNSPLPADFLERLKQCIAEERRNDALKMFLRRVGLPAPALWLMRLLPVWKKLKGVAHTLVYDMTIVEPYSYGKPFPPGEWAAVRLPVLVADGGKSPLWMRNAMRALGAALPNASYLTLEGQTHMLKPKAVAPVMIEFFRVGQESEVRSQKSE